MFVDINVAYLARHSDTFVMFSEMILTVILGHNDFPVTFATRK